MLFAYGEKIRIVGYVRVKDFKLIRLAEEFEVRVDMAGLLDVCALLTHGPCDSCLCHSRAKAKSKKRRIKLREFVERELSCNQYSASQ